MGLSIGGWEILLILIIALIIWGPDKLPEIARTIGKVVRTLRKASFDLTNVVTREIEETSRQAKPENSSESKEEKPPPHPGTVSAQEKTQTRNQEGRQPENE